MFHPGVCLPCCRRLVGKEAYGERHTQILLSQTGFDFFLIKNRLRIMNLKQIVGYL
jgi:hypothetical protein